LDSLQEARSRFLSNQPVFPELRSATSEHEDVQFLELAGVEKVFDESHGMPSWKALVKIELPRWGLQASSLCFMALAIDDEDIERLAAALLDREVKKTPQNWYITTHEGYLETVPRLLTSKVALAGVPGDAIKEVLGPDIYSAINEGPIRREELDKGKHRTICVSMNLTMNGAFINLCLDLSRGFEIAQQLFSIS
jgi:hypothetical protein